MVLGQEPGCGTVTVVQVVQGFHDVPRVALAPPWSCTVLPNTPASCGARACASFRWHDEHARSWNSFSPAAAGESDALPPPSQAWNAFGSIAITDPTMPECFVPQYSAQNRW